MFFIIWGWAQRVRTEGVAGPFRCGTCGWAGTFWVRTVERRFKLYFVQIGKWRPRSTVTVCRNCGNGSTVPKENVASLLATVQPITAPDPFGPQPSPEPAPPASPGAAALAALAPEDRPPDCQFCGAPVDGVADRCGACGRRLQPLRAH